MNRRYWKRRHPHRLLKTVAGEGDSGGHRWRGAAVLLCVGVVLFLTACFRDRPWTPYRAPESRVLETRSMRVDFLEPGRDITALDANCTMAGCHAGVEDPHTRDSFPIACVDCHGGDPAGRAMETAHPRPRFPDRWPSAANPERSYVLLNTESWDWIRFVNPGDLRVANTVCGPCHRDHFLQVSKSLMTNAAHFWGAAAYCNGVVSTKRTIFGESYSPEGIPQKVNTVWSDPREKEIDLAHGVVESVVPLPHWEVTQPGNILRVFEKGSRRGGVALGLNGSAAPLVGIPDKLARPGRPNNRLSPRGLGTLGRVDLAVLNLQKTRLNDPYLSFLGTNDHPGDYRSSGCTACHVVYANDRSPVHSGPYARYGNRGRSFGSDPAIPGDESGHPIRHEFTLAIPSSQCMTCHHHQPNSFLNTYFGYTMWSYETDGEKLWPAEQMDPTHEQLVSVLKRNPEGAAPRSRWGTDREFLRSVSTALNPGLKDTQFADYHGHGWIFRAIFKMDRRGNLLDAEGKRIPYDDPDKFKGVIPLAAEEGDKPAGPHFSEAAKAAGRRTVHLKDIHAERGLHCVDCHYTQDVHGSQKLYSEYQGAVEIQCEDCHGTISLRARLSPSGPASYTKDFARSFSSGAHGRTFRELETPWSEARFYEKGGEIWQRSMVERDLEWRVPQVVDSVTPGHPRYNERSARAKTVRVDNETWGPPGASDLELAHEPSRMTCYACHTSWITSCFGCHLPQKSNMRTPMRHFEDRTLRNLASYNPQVARDDCFMLGIAPDVQKNKVSTVRSSSALLISSQNADRRDIYTQIPTIAANGMSSQAFNTHFAHTVRRTETRSCEDCHVSERNDNNAWLAQVLLLGTGFVNFLGHRIYVGSESGFYAVKATEWEEPQAVLGSNLHRLAFPRHHAEFVAAGRLLDEAEHHGGAAEVRSLQLRGEYLYTASGPAGLRVYDVANVSNEAFSQKIVTAPVSPLGQSTTVAMRNATDVALPTNQHISTSRVYRPENREQKYLYEGRAQNLHELYRYAYVSDAEEGLVIVDADCLSDGDPENNFLRRVDLDGRGSFNPGGKLDGAVGLTVAGETIYLCAAAGLFAISIEDPRRPRLLGSVRAPDVTRPRRVAVQFRYAFVVDSEGVKVLDITDPGAPRSVAGAALPLPGARDIYVARTYGYVAAGAEGLVILDLERPEEPRELLRWTDGGRVNDLEQVKVGMTNDTVFAYLADGRNGLRVVQLISPEDTAETKRSAYGFSPVPRPKLIATFPTGAPALAISKGLDRDRAVDESGNQIAVFGRIGGRPFTLEEMRKLYLKDGEVFRVSNEPHTRMSRPQ